ncbi:MAG TPA: alpha/beta hydrolase [Methylomirabilota bacterium]|nr:alpha/beta hydrolase [Methylomirabilota bacterium]
MADFVVEDVEYLRHGDKPLLARLFRPAGDGPFPMMVDLHGGAWCNGNRTNDVVMNEALAKSGVIVAALDFRMPPDAGYPASLADIHYGIRWLKARAREIKGRADRVGAIGISSGGHQAMLLAMRPNDARYAAQALPAGSPSPAGAARIDARLRCVVLCWPVIDPLGRYHYAKKLKAAGPPYPEVVDRVLPLHDLYWPGEAAMAEGNPVLAMERGEPVETPPVLYLQGTKDVAHPRPDLDRFVAGYRQRGGQVELELYEGEAEGFVNRNPNSPAAAQAVARILEFVAKQLG